MPVISLRGRGHQYDQLTSGMRCVGGNAACKCPFLSGSNGTRGAAAGAMAPAIGWPRAKGETRDGIKVLLTSAWAGTA